MKLLKTFWLVPTAWLAGISCAHMKDNANSSGGSQWRALFDGKGTQGWEMVGPGELKLENGELVTCGGMGMLWYSKEKLGNCEIRVVFKLSRPDDNSGVFIRIPERPQTPWDGVNKGHEIQIDNTENEWHRTGCLYSLTKAKATASPKAGEWSTMLIILDHKRTIVKIDGQVVTDYREGSAVPEKKEWYEPDRGLRPEFGYIGLQNHGGEAHVHFKEVTVRPLAR
ncbi:MAG: DUF1080 domain-containing protein [Verrucomicrobiota bacterium]